MNIFITGTVGSGKSSFSKLLMKHLDPNHFQLLDLDSQGKQIVQEHNIDVPKDKNLLFSDQMALFYVEKKVWQHINLPTTEKTLIIEASTFFESPKIFSKDDVVISVESDNFEENVLNRDGVDRASLINKNQLSKKVKSICADYIVLNNGNLEDLEQKAKFFADNLNYQKTKQFVQEINFLKEQWRKHFSELPPILFNNLIKEYIRLDRFYHNHAHLIYLLNLFQSYAQGNIFTTLWKRAILLAIFYHDVKMKFSLDAENEHDSVKFLFESFREYDLLKTSFSGSRSYVTLAADMILATKQHKINEFISSSEHGENHFKIFLDLDMFILSDEVNIDLYEEGIRKEWMNFSDEQYQQGRTKVLSSFLEQDIYQSDMFSNRNQIAKDLIKQLILKLRNNI